MPDNISFTERLGCFASSFSNSALPIPITSGIPPGIPPGITSATVLVITVNFFSTVAIDIFPENKNKNALETKSIILNAGRIYIVNINPTYICTPTNTNNPNQIIIHNNIFKINKNILLAILSFASSSLLIHL